MMVEPVRRCAGCGRKAGKSELIRVVRLPAGDVVFDPEMIRQGRSLYFCARLECFEALMKRRAPDKLMKATIPTDLRDEIINYLSRPESDI